MATVKVVNIVASASFGGNLDLDAIARALEGAQYDPERFPGLIYRLKDPKIAVLLFESGKSVCTGAHSLASVDAGMREVAKRVDAAGIAINSRPSIEVQNIVATGDLGQPINLAMVTLALGTENTEYEPEQFPGLIYRMESPKVVLLVFASGKVVCTGATKVEDAEAAVHKLAESLSAAGLLGPIGHDAWLKVGQG